MGKASGQDIQEPFFALVSSAMIADTIKKSRGLQRADFMPV
jgi:hypothetical protein